MKSLPDIVSRDAPADISEAYLNLSQDSRYGHFARIPDRICRCLDYFQIDCNRVAVRERLHSYYLFIGVVDDLIDSTQLEAGSEILGHFDNRIPCFNREIYQSRAGLAAEVLKCHIDDEIYSTALDELEQLYQAVVRERKGRTIKAYIEERKVVGRLTAKLSYLLMRPLFETEREDFCRFLQDVGEVGCLIDSVIDLKADDRLGLLSFSSTLDDRLRLLAIALRHGIKISVKHPRLFVLFLEALGDNVLDRLRSISVTRRRVTRPNSKTNSAASSGNTEALPGVAWTEP